jgi:hypothetical protein
MSATTVRPCNCNHQYQDRVYGKGMRVHNVSPKTEASVCTVCGAQKARGGTA